MHIEWNKVTWYSKLVAVIVFVVVGYLGFCFGRNYQAALDGQRYISALQSPADK